MLVEDISRTSRAVLSKVARGISEEMISKTFISLVLKGKIQMAVRFVTLQGAGGVLSPNVTDTKSGRPVIDVLWQKYLVPIVPAVEVLDHYNAIPEFVPLKVTENTVETISGRLTGAAGPGSINAAGLQQWLLRFGIVSQRLRCAVALLTR